MPERIGRASGPRPSARRAPVDPRLRCEVAGRQPSSAAPSTQTADHAEPRQAVEGRVGRRTVQAATSSPAPRASPSDARVERPPVDRDAPAAERQRRRRRPAASRVTVLSQRGQPGARWATPRAPGGSNDETTALWSSGPRPAASTSTTARSGIVLELDVEERRAGPTAREHLRERRARPRRRGRRTRSASTRSGRPWTRCEGVVVADDGDAVGGQRGRRTRARRRPGRPSAARKAASVFSGARRQSPRWARRSVRGAVNGPPASADPISSWAATARGGRSGRASGRPDRGRSNTSRADATRTAPRTQM